MDIRKEEAPPNVALVKKVHVENFKTNVYGKQ